MWFKISIGWTLSGCNTDWYQCESEDEARVLAETMAETLANGQVSPDTGTAGLLGIGFVQVTPTKVKA